jgi:arginase family enzyme
MNTAALFFPFDLFGSAGTGQGALLLADALREMLADNRRETRPTRAAAYQDRVRVREFAFETLKDYHGWRARARRAVRAVWKRGDFLLWVAGNHLGSLPVYDELSGDGDALVVQFDAHLDTYNLAGCTEELSHGNFLRHCAGPLPPVVNLGHRDLFLPESGWRPFFEAAYSTADLVAGGEAVLGRLRQRVRRARRVVIDIDCDVFDPSSVPAVAQPQPFGPTPLEFLRWLDAAWSERVVGVALSEFDPARDPGDRSLAVLIWLLEYVLLKRYEMGGT